MKMTDSQWDYYQQAAKRGTVKDELNPVFIFGMTHNELLVKIASGELDAKDLAKRELAARGFDVKGHPNYH